VARFGFSKTGAKKSNDVVIYGAARSPPPTGMGWGLFEGIPSYLSLASFRQLRRQSLIVAAARLAKLVASRKVSACARPTTSF
jgi:hypothetical protein